VIHRAWIFVAEYRPIRITATGREGLKTRFKNAKLCTSKNNRLKISGRWHKR
jgi:hypothetical protein